MLSRCFLDFSVGVGAFVIGLSQISSFFSKYKQNIHVNVLNCISFKENMTLFVFAVVLMLCTGCNGADITVPLSSVNDLGGGHFQGHFRFPVRGEDIMAWEAILTFDAPVNGLSVSFPFYGKFYS